MKVFQDTEYSKGARAGVLLVVFSILIFLAYLFAKFFVSTWENLANTDFMTFWLAGKSLVMDFDAYNPEEWQYWNRFFGSTWIFNPRFIYPLPLRLFLYPWGLIPFHSAYVVWTILSQFLVVFSVSLLYFRSQQTSKLSTFIFILIGAFMFRATYATLRFGQIGPWLLLCLALVIFLWERNKPFWSGFVLALTVMKPTIGGPFILFVLIWWAVKKEWKAVYGVLTGGIMLLVLGLLQDPLWVFKFLQSGNQKFGETFAYGPNLWGLARLLTNGESIGIAGLLLSVTLVGLVTWFIIANFPKLTFKDFVSLVTPVVVVITPYVWGYDQIFLLIPLALLVTLFEDYSYPYWIVSLTFVFATIVSYLFVIPSQVYHYDYVSVFLPLSVLGVLIVFLSKRGIEKKNRLDSQSERTI